MSQMYREPTTKVKGKSAVCITANSLCPPPSIKISGIAKHTVIPSQSSVLTYKVNDEIQLNAIVNRNECLDQGSNVLSALHVIQMKELQLKLNSPIAYWLLKGVTTVHIPFISNPAFGSSSLYLPSGSLDPGSYFAVFSLTEQPYCGPDSYFVADVVKLQINPNPLNAIIVGGSFVEWPILQLNAFKLNGLKSLEFWSPFSGIVIKWLCHRPWQAEDFRRMLQELNEKKSLTVIQSNKGGCFKKGFLLRDEDLETNPLEAWDLRVIYLNKTQFLRDDGDYIITILLLRDSTSDVALFHQTVKVTFRIGPGVTAGIECVENCGKPVVRSRLLRLRVLCGGCKRLKLKTHQNLVYKWLLTTPSGEILAKSKVERYRNNSDNTYVVVPSDFKHVGQISAELEMMIDGNPGQTLSSAHYIFELAPGPSTGLCNIQPTSGVAMKTTFSIQCFNFGDNEYVTYKVYLSDDVLPGLSSDLQETVVYDGADNTIKDLLLPPGRSEFGYRLKIRIVATNTHGDASFTVVYCQVAQPASEDILSLLGSGVLEKNSLLKQLIKTGYINGPIPFITSATAVMKASPPDLNISASVYVIAGVTMAEELKKLKPNSLSDAARIFHAVADICECMKGFAPFVEGLHAESIINSTRWIVESLTASIRDVPVAYISINYPHVKTLLVSAMNVFSELTQLASETPSVSVAEQMESFKQREKVLRMMDKLNKISKNFKEVSVTENELVEIIHPVHNNSNMNPKSTTNKGLVVTNSFVNDTEDEKSVAVSTFYYNPFKAKIAQRSVRNSSEINLPVVGMSVLRMGNGSTNASSTTSPKLHQKAPSDFKLFLPLKALAGQHDDVIETEAITSIYLPPPCHKNTLDLKEIIESRENSHQHIANFQKKCGSALLEINLDSGKLEVESRKRSLSAKKRSADDEPVAFLVFRVKRPCRFPNLPCIGVNFVKSTKPSSSCSGGNCDDEYEVIHFVALPKQRFVDEGVAEDPWSIPITNNLLKHNTEDKHSTVVLLVEDLQGDPLYEKRNTFDVENHQKVIINMLRADCFAWINNLEEWNSANCSAGTFVTNGRLLCKCKQDLPDGLEIPLMFAASLIILPNAINFLDMGSLLSKLYNNAYIVLTVMIWWFVFLPAFAWSRRQDKLDQLKRKIVIPSDSDPRDSFLYEVVVFTGVMKTAGTSANVTIVLEGENGVCSLPHVISNLSSGLLQRGSVDTFLITSSNNLGQVASVKLWHDNKGSNPAWYLERVAVYDLQAKTKPSSCSFFVGWRWLALDVFPFSCELKMNRATREDLISFQTLWRIGFVKEVQDANIWTSAFHRPACSTFSCTQRIACCSVAVFGFMLVSIMFYGSTGVDTYRASVGYVTLDLSTAVSSAEAAVLMMPVNYFVNYVFRHLPPDELSHQSRSSVEITKKDTTDKSNVSIVIEDCNEWPHPSGIGTMDLTVHHIHAKPSWLKTPNMYLNHPSERSIITGLNVEEQHNSRSENSEEIIPAVLSREDSSPVSSDQSDTEVWYDAVTDLQESRDVFAHVLVDLSKIRNFAAKNLSSFRQAEEFKHEEPSDFSQTNVSVHSTCIPKSVLNTKSDEMCGVLLCEVTSSHYPLYGSTTGLDEEEEPCSSVTLPTVSKPLTLIKEPLITLEFEEEPNQEVKLVGNDEDANIGSSFLSENKDQIITDYKLQLKESLNYLLDTAGYHLPSWTKWLAWGAVLVHWLASSILTALYGLQFGNEKFLHWLLTFALSMVQNMFIMTPLRMVFVAILGAFTHGGKVQIEDWIGFRERWAREEAVARWQRMQEEYNDRVFVDATSRLDVKAYKIHPLASLRMIEIRKLPWCYREPTFDELEKAGQLRLTVAQVRRFWWEAVSWILMMFFLTFLVFIQRDSRLVALEQEVRSNFVNEFDSIQTYNDVFDFLEHSLTPSLYKKFEETDSEQFHLLGAFRLRQHRLMPTECPSSIMSSSRKCKKHDGDPFLSSSYDVASYLPNWKVHDTNSSLIDDVNDYMRSNPWEYSQQKYYLDTGYPLGNSLRRSYYPTGGYMIDLGYSSEEVTAVIKGLRNTQWINRDSAAVFVDFSILNPQLNLLTSVSLVVEILAQSGFNHYHDINSYRPPYLYKMSDVGVALVQLLHFVINGFLIADLVSQCKNLRWKRKAVLNFLLDVWNALTIITVLLSLAVYVLFTLHVVSAFVMSQSHRQDRSRFSPFFVPARYSRTYFFLLAFLTFFSYIRVLKLFRGSHIVSVMLDALHHAFHELIGVTFVTVVAVLAFGHAANYIFGTRKGPFRNVMASAETLYSLVAGLDATHPEQGVHSDILWAFFFAIFMIVAVSVFVNLHAAVMEIAYRDIHRSRREHREYPVESLALVWLYEQVLLLLGLTTSAFKRKLKKGRYLTSNNSTSDVTFHSVNENRDQTSQTNSRKYEAESPSPPPKPPLVRALQGLIERHEKRTKFNHITDLLEKRIKRFT
ncbi:polycystin family receptor for egg jelly-like isoform X3 [Clavelina lepadiformis]|uniref:polycystin family receptor for egg jelly-like isoform X3 n=1 Tax=Clavelina lepadiformis TaxID=159417 RepID=UPI004041D0C9